MRPLLLLLLLLALIACTAEHAASDGDPARLPGAEAVAGGADAARIAGDDCVGDAQIGSLGVGIVRLGASLEVVRQRCGGSDTTFTLGEGIMERGVVLRVAGARVVAMSAPAGDSVARVIFPDPGPVTDGGIGIGSTVAELRDAHGELCPLQGEGRIVLMTRGLDGVSFVTSAGPHPPADTAVVTQIFAHGQRTC